MWPAGLWFYSLMPWLIATQLPAAFCAAMMRAGEATPHSAEIIPFPRARRAAAR
jgi:hypothetical protein